jgi:hypothetical protein
MTRSSNETGIEVNIGEEQAKGVSDDPILRTRLAHLLETGLQTEWQQRAYTSEEVNHVVSRLQQLPVDDYQAKLQIAGFTSQAYRPPEDVDIEQSCSTCMYFERYRQFCNLPELQLPVVPEWSCKLWRI